MLHVKRRLVNDTCPSVLKRLLLLLLLLLLPDGNE